MIKKAITIASILALTACGGGGGSDSGSPTPNTPDNGNGNNSSNTAPTISSPYTSIYMDENSTLSIPLTVANTENETLQFEIDTTAEINASVNASNNLIITTGEVQEDSQTFLTVIVTDEGNLRDDVKFNLYIENVVQETDQIALEVNPRTITLYSPKSSQDYPDNLGSQIFYNVISKDVSNNVNVNFDKIPPSGSFLKNPYFDIETTQESVGYTLRVRSHESYQQDIVDNGYNSTTLNITANNGINSDTKAVTVVIEELNQQNLELRLEALIEDINSLASLPTEEESAVIEYIVEYLENTEQINAKEKQEILLNLQEMISNITLNSSANELNLYNVGGITENGIFLGASIILDLSRNGSVNNVEELLALISNMDIENIERRILLIKQERYEEHAEYFENFIEDLDNRYNLDFPELDLSNRFESDQGLSVFIGNGDFGYLNGTKWRAFKRYSFLEGVLAKLYNTTEFNINSGTTSSEGGE